MIFIPEDDDFNIDELNDSDEEDDNDMDYEYLEELRIMENSLKFENGRIVIPYEMKNDEEMGTEHLAASVAYQMHKIDPSLGCSINETMNVSKFVRSTFIDQMSRNSLYYPSFDFLQEIREIVFLFQNYHLPNYSFRKNHKNVTVVFARYLKYRDLCIKNCTKMI